LRLPFELERWAARSAANRVVKLTVLRTVGHAPQRQTLELAWDVAYAGESAPQLGVGAPVALNGLGLAYQVLAVVDVVEPFVAAERGLPPADRKTPSPAARAGLKPNDKVTAVKFRAVDYEGQPVERKFEPVQPHQWPYADATLQQQAPHGVTVKFERDGQEMTADLDATPDPTWPVPAQGLSFVKATVVQKADGVLEALQMGVYRTWRGLRMTYQGLYGIVLGDVSVKAMSGPISLGRLSYLIAGQDIWHLILWLAMISINLAVVNFMPIPVLDGGHMVFLIYEGVRGKPAPESVQVLLTYLGLAMVACLMLFVVGLDLWRLFFA
jgi:regulator of sigma E protease